MTPGIGVLTSGDRGEELSLVSVGRIQVGTDGLGTGEAVVKETVRVGGVAIDIATSGIIPDG